MSLKVCKHCRSPFSVAAEDRQLLQKIAPRIGNDIFQIPDPTLCPRCRVQRRMAHRNQIYVQLKTAAGSAQRLFSMYLGETPFPVISNEQWWAETSWSPESFGRDFDFSRPFFEQWKELRDAVPRPALNTISTTIENSDYSNNCGFIKNCYLCFDADRSEDCLYLETLSDCTDCVDCSVVLDCQLCYDCTGCSNCYNLQSSLDCAECSDSCYLSSCRSCSHCFGCVNLRRKKYCVYNEQLSAADYQAFIRSLDLTSWSARNELARAASEFRAGQPRAHLVATRIENCSGNYIHNSRNIWNSFLVKDAEDLRYCDVVKTGAKSCLDCTISFLAPELMYECAICGLSVRQLAFCYNCWDGACDLLYCDTSHGSKDCFGCVCLRKRQYCILNKQYSKEQYFQLLPRIIGHLRQTGEWGEFFPMQLSPWPYNFSYASRYFPLPEEQARSEGLPWLEADAVSPALGSAEALPDALPESNAPITARSELSGRLFRITAEEIKRLRKFGAPLPRLAYDERMNERAARCGGIELRTRACALTGVEVQTVYTPQEAPLLWEKQAYDREFE